MDVDIESDGTDRILMQDACSTDEIETILCDLLNRIEKQLGEELEHLKAAVMQHDRPKSPVDSVQSIFTFTNTCDSCGVQDSLFWRRVARTKIVCNDCFHTQTYLLLFRDSKHKKLNSPDTDPDEQEPVKYVKKTRASLKNLLEKKTDSHPVISSLRNEFDVSHPNMISSASSTVSSCSTKNNEKLESIDIAQDKMDINFDDTVYAITRKSARFASSSNKCKKNENSGKTSGKMNNKNNKKSRKSDETQSDKASPITSPLSALRTIDPRSNQTNLKSRRTKVFKSENSVPVKSQVLTSTIFTSDFVFHRGFYIQVGDIVALFDVDDEEEEIPYFAQIRAFLTDQYGQKSAVITWLIPIDSNYAKTICSPKDFNPDMFVLGPAEEYPRSLECLEFVCRLIDHSAKMKRSDYFNNSYQFKNDLLRHRFLLSDLAASNLQLITKKSLTDSSRVEHEIKWT